MAGSDPEILAQFESSDPLGNRAYQEADGQHEPGATQDSHGFGREDNGRNVTPLFVTDDWSERIQRFRNETLQGKRGLSRFKDVGSVEELFKRPDIPQPLVRRGSHGLPGRLDSYLKKERTQAIGNAVVPQVAQFVARRMKTLFPDYRIDT
jgi:hypothetical protein